MAELEAFVLEKKKDGNGFNLAWEDDFARPASAQSEVLSALNKPGTQPGKDASIAFGASLPVGTVIVKLTGNTGAAYSE